MSLANLLKDPALVVGVVRAALILLVSFGVEVTQGQQDSLLGFVGILLAFISLVLTGVTSAATTSKAAPVLPVGTDVTIATPASQADRVVTLTSTTGSPVPPA